MSQQILVRGQTTWKSVVLRLLGLALLAAGGVSFALNKQAAAISFAIAGGAVLLPVELVLLFARSRRRWVEDTGSGFTVTDSQGMREYSDNQVTDISHYTLEKFSEGNLKSLRRHFVVWMEGQPDPIEMVNTIKVDTYDPLGELIERLLEDLRQRSDAILDRGGTITGDGWSLANNYLTIEKSGFGEPVAVDQLADVGIFDGRLCIWRRGEEHAFAKLSLSSRNCYLLQVLLGERIPEQEETAEAGSGLGRILFERRGRTISAVLCATIGCFVLLGSVGALLGAESLIGGIIASLFGLLLIVAAVGVKTSRFRCNERGVHKSGIFGSKELFYNDVASFSYGATRQFVNGVYSGTSLSMGFTPAADSGLKGITYNTQVKGDDDDLEMLRDHISGVIAAQMAGQLADGYDVAWTDNISFRQEDFAFRPAGFFGRKEWQSLPYNQVHGYDMKEGVFYLWQQGIEKPVFQEQVSTSNFFPGFFLFMDLLYGEDESGQQEQYDDGQQQYEASE